MHADNSLAVQSREKQHKTLIFHSIYQSHSQNDSGDLRGVAGGDGKLECLCGKAGASCVCDGPAHSSGCMVNGSIEFVCMVP